MDSMKINKLRDWLEKYQNDKSGRLLLDISDENANTFGFICDPETELFTLKYVYDKGYKDLPCDILGTDCSLQDVLAFCTQSDITGAYSVWEGSRDIEFSTED